MITVGEDTSMNLVTILCNDCGYVSATHVIIAEDTHRKPTINLCLGCLTTLGTKIQLLCGGDSKVNK